MMTEQKDYDVQLQEYLEEQLTLIPDTDPQLLSKLVLALLKMDLPMEDLKNLCKEKLEDFLKYRTVQFVENLFSYISSITNTQSTDYKTIHANHQNAMNMDHSLIDDNDPAFRRRQRFGDSAYKQVGVDDSFSRRGRGISRPSGIRKPFISKRSHYHHHSFVPQNFTLSRTQGKRLFVDSIPNEFNSKDAIENYFSKFGPVHLVDHQGNRAAIEFERQEHAVSAFSSPEPIFQNRFVKLSWDISASEHSEKMEQLKELQKQKEELLAKQIQQRDDIYTKLSYATPDQAQELQKTLQIVQSYISQLQGEKPVGKFSYKANSQQMKGSITWRPTKLDLRPKTITISPIPSQLEIEENVRKYFGQFGIILSVEFCQSHVEVQYKERYEAENAMKLGTKISFGGVQPSFKLEWKSSTSSNAPVTNQMLLSNSDAWDEDSYEKSWKR